MSKSRFHVALALTIGIGISPLAVSPAIAQQPDPVLNTLFPAGGQAGTTLDVKVAGSALEGLERLYCLHPGLTFAAAENGLVRVTIAKETPPGIYDLRAVCATGLSSPRAFVVGNRGEQLEVVPQAAAAQAAAGTAAAQDVADAQRVPLDSVVNGRIVPGEVDSFRFDAKQGQLVIVECWAERIDSPLRAVLEVYDESGRRLAANRGYFGVDPLIPFRVPADGAYVVKVFDLVYAGGDAHVYRLDVGTGPRVAFTVPCVIEAGKTTSVACYGWNLGTGTGAGGDTTAGGTPAPQLAAGGDMARVEVAITPPESPATAYVSGPRSPSQLAVEGFDYLYPKSQVPVFVGITDVPVAGDGSGNHAPGSARQIAVPCEVSGQLLAGDEQDWFAVEAKRGEVLWIEALGERIGSRVDLDLRVLDAAGTTELARFADEVQNDGGEAFPTSHLDPSGRFVAPTDGRYLILLRNLIGGLDDDPRRLYRLSVRREEPDFALAVVPRRDDPAGLNVPRGGRTIADVVALRRRGLTGAIRVRAKNLPAGIDCPDVWLGPGVSRAPLVISASADAEPGVVPLLSAGTTRPDSSGPPLPAESSATLELEGWAEAAGSRPVRGATVVRAGGPTGWCRLTDGIPLAVAGEAAVRITADGHETRRHHLYGDLKVRHSPGSILDVAVEVERRDGDHQAAVQLIGVGLPDLIRNQTATIPAGQDKGYISFFLPPALPVGRYSIAVEARTQAPKPVTLISNVVTFDVEPAAFVVEVDLNSPRRIRRGETVQVDYSARRVNGFIGKIHTELEAPIEVEGLRGRGVTFVGQTETGTIQIIANDDAPLGQQPFLRLTGIGTIEDQPVYHGSCWLNLEIVDKP